MGVFFGKNSGLGKKNTFGERNPLTEWALSAYTYNNRDFEIGTLLARTVAFKIQQP